MPGTDPQPLERVDVGSDKFDPDLINRAYMEKSANDFFLFTRGLTIPSATGPRLYELCMADFQKESFASLGPSLHAVRDGSPPPVRRFWIERTKKAGKDSDLAICLVWLIAFARRPVKCQVVAANSRQARIIEDRAVELVHYNQWLGDKVEIIQSCIRSRKMPKEAWVRIEATGTSGEAQGQTPDVLVLNELVHVDKWSVMQTHWNNASGVPQGIIIVSTNAGIRNSKAWVWRKNAIENQQRWKVHIWSKLAPWISEEDVEEAKKNDPIGAEFARLWRGQWISGVGGAVDEASIEDAFCLGGPTQQPAPGWRYIAGLDLGISHDHAGLVVMGVNAQDGLLHTACIRRWKPDTPQGNKLEVDLMAVEDECRRLAERFDIEWFGYDPAAGGSMMAQRLRASSIPMQAVEFSRPGNLTAMATAFVVALKDRVLKCYDLPDGTLRRDFGKFQIEHRPPSKYKLTAISDEFGHADAGTALAITLPRAMEMLEHHAGRWREDDVIGDMDMPEDLTDEEIENMDPVLREIYEMDEGGVDEYIRRPGAWRRKKKRRRIVRGSATEDEESLIRGEEEKEDERLLHSLGIQEGRRRNRRHRTQVVREPLEEE